MAQPMEKSQEKRLTMQCRQGSYGFTDLLLFDDAQERRGRSRVLAGRFLRHRDVQRLLTPDASQFVDGAIADKPQEPGSGEPVGR